MYSDSEPFSSEAAGRPDHGSPNAQSPSPVENASQRQDRTQWYWSPEHRDYIQYRGNELLLYREYQRSGYTTDTKSSESAEPPKAEDFYRGGSSSSRTSYGEFTTGQAPRQSRPDFGTFGRDLEARFHALRSPSQSEAAYGESRSTILDSTSLTESRPARSFDAPPDSRFRMVDKPKRFFSVGRIFKAVWFEPGGSDTVSRRADSEYTQECRPFHGERPYARFRWFIVVRKRLHHSLCFSITSSGGKASTQTGRGRSKDFVVLYSSSVVEPPDPSPEEGIVRKPIAVIIEDGQQFISPFARLDCGRIYTVEDNLQVMKIGRVLPESLPDLEAYFRESVE